MEEEIQEFGGEGIDVDYEFDAPRFCDFTRSETYWEAEEAEQWFHSAQSYPPSPFIVKLRLGNATSMEIVNGSTQHVDDDSAYCVEPKVFAVDDDSRGLEFNNHSNQDILEVKTKPLCKSTRSNSTLMKPTVSYLAKQKNPLEVHTTRFSRFQNQNASPLDGQATKRQKLEVGYLGKASHLKHQAHFTHKGPKKVDLIGAKLACKATIPQQPELETAHRAQRHKSRINAEFGGDTTSSQMFRARPLNRKILKAPPVPFLKKSSQLPECHVMVLGSKAPERAMQHKSSNAEGIISCNSIPNCETRDLRRPNSTNASRQQNGQVVNKLSRSPDDMELKFTNDKKLPYEPPMELFSKLSLASEPKENTKYLLKEQPILQLWEKQYQCVA